MQKQSGVNSFRQWYPLLYLLPILLTGAAVLSFGVNVPFLDQWAMVDYFRVMKEGTLQFWQLWAQHNEHRIVIPRLVFLALGFASNWNTILEMLFGVLLISVVLFVLFVLNERTLRRLPEGDRLLPRAAFLVSGFILFSLAQHENWFWGFQVTFFLVQFFAALSILVLLIGTVSSFSWRFCIAALLCVAASFSVAQGLLTWLAMLPLVATSPKTRRSRTVATLVWLSLAAVTGALYFHQYVSPGGAYTPDRYYALKHPVEAAHFLMVLLGNQFSRLGGGGVFGPQFGQPGGADVKAILTLATVIGAAFLIAYLLLAVHAIRIKAFEAYKPWIALGLFGLLSTMMITVGRSGWGLEGALTSRYQTAPTFLLVSVVQMAAFTFRAQRSRLKFYGFSVVLVVLLCAIAVNTISSVPQITKIQKGRQLGKVCLELVRYVDMTLDNTPYHCLWNLYPIKVEGKTGFLRAAEILEQLGFRKLASNFRFVEAPSSDWGGFDQPGGVTQQAIPEQTIQLSGWAVLPDRQQLPEAIAISINDQRTFITAVRPDVTRPDSAQLSESTRSKNSGWTAEIPLDLLPNGEVKFHAWVYDPQNQQFVKLAEPNGPIQVVTR